MTGITYSIIIALVLIAATIVIHYEVLGATSRTIPGLRIRDVRAKMLLVMAGIFIAHLLEVGLYAIAYYVMQHHFGLGEIEGRVREDFMDFFYFSLTSYTTLGVGDLYATGPVRIVVGTESLNGFVLIGWSASYTFLAMQRFWQQKTGRKGGLFE